MIWHICKKDLRLLWPWVLLLTALQAALHAFVFALGPFPKERLVASENSFKAGLLIAIATMIALVVQQDGIPGLTLDWLVRPIRRSHLFLAKLLFLVLAILLPIAIADFTECLMTGFAAPQALAATLSHALWLLLRLILPLFAVAAMTRGIADFAATVLLLFLAIAWLDRVPMQDYLTVGRVFSILIDRWDDLSWFSTLAKSLVILAGSLLAFWLLYARRLTARARLLFPLFVLGGFLLAYTPWQAVIPLLSHMSRDLEASRSIAVEFDPTRPSWHVAPTQYPSTEFAAIPLKVTGVPSDGQLFVDAADVKVFGGDGILVADQVASLAFSEGRPAAYLYSGREAVSYLAIWRFNEEGVGKRLREQPLKLVIDLALTLAEPEGEEFAFSPGDTPISLPKLGVCQMKKREDGGAPPTALGCLQAGSVTDWSLLSVYAGEEAKPYGQLLRASNGTSFFAQLLPDAIDRTTSYFMRSGTRLMLPLLGLSPNSRFTLRNFRSIAHFRYRLEIPAIWLEDWVAVNDPALNE